MKILYLGTLCDIKEYEKMLQSCKDKPSVASVVFESALLTGLCSEGAQVDVYSYPMIPPYPDSPYLYWGNIKQSLPCGYRCTWLKTVNVPIIKQLSRKLNGRKLIKKWLKANKNEDCVLLSYSIPPFLAKDIVRLAKRYGAKSVAIVTDLPRDMYINSGSKGIKKWARERYLSGAIKAQGSFDGYVYLTEAMAEVVNPKAPYIIMEGIADISIASEEGTAKERAIMYAGTLEEKFGVLNLLNAFEKAYIKDAALWIFGSGNAAEEIEKRSLKNSNICYFGRKSREEILEYEKKAMLLVNPRGTEDEYTKYSFPSKTVEYMLSGTATLTTRLAGIPKEYYGYLLLCEDNGISSLEQAIKQAFDMGEAELTALGERAKRFIINEKNEKRQAKRLSCFLERISGIDKT